MCSLVTARLLKPQILQPWISLPIHSNIHNPSLLVSPRLYLIASHSSKFTTQLNPMCPLPHPSPESAGTDSASAEHQPSARSLQEARKLAAPVLSAAATAAAATAVPSAKPSKGAGKTDAASGLMPAQAMAQLKAAAEACEAVMNKLSSASNAAGQHCCLT